MAEEKDSGEKTEEATPQRREDFRKQGQVAMTRELSAAFVLFGSALVIWLMSRFFLEQLVALCKTLIGTFAGTSGKNGEFMEPAVFALQKAVFVLGPVFLIFGLLAIMATTLQIGLLTNTEALEPKLDKINPINGLQKMFSLRSVVEGLKATLKVTIVGIIAYLIIQGEFLVAPKLVNSSPEQMIQYYINVSVKLFFGIGLFMIFLALIDYGYQWWDMEKKMMMTKQEVKEEIKSREGNPQIKARIRRIQREMAQKRMMESVPKADVIITNPTHIAIALKYDANLPAPQIIAKGADLIAEKIKEIARQHNIPIVENKPLARTIFKTLKIGQVIPRELFNAVAEVLAYVYRLKKKVVN